MQAKGWEVETLCFQIHFLFVMEKYIIYEYVYEHRERKRFIIDNDGQWSEQVYYEFISVPRERRVPRARINRVPREIDDKNVKQERRICVRSS